MFLLRHLRLSIGSDNLSVEDNKVGWERAQRIFEFFFSIVEAGVVLGILQAAWKTLQSDLLLILWLSGYLAMGVYLVSTMNYLLSQAFRRFGWDETKKAVRVVYRLLTGIVGISIPYLISGLTSDALVEAFS